ncbi:hypothetical protein FA95DRAFT_1502018 [Auriscalpium vulgare]|uniref:Uncharacterized protein n=1 Tax=Auriscalpium vulgare TaxID=40419 RepID=A0ACB8RAN5_9AGAM|nr:hypothetical protein FA95DRAFT_1502018 [Auriscalpium vulgare]
MFAYPPRPPRLPIPSPQHSAPACKPVNLPTEVILTILEAAYLTPTLQPDRRLLTTASGVCRSWSGPAQALLFRDVVLHSELAYAAFMSATRPCTPRGLAHARCVRTLHAIVDNAQPGGLRAVSFAGAVGRCPNLQDVDLSCFGAPPVPESESAPTASRTSTAPSGAGAHAFFDAHALALLRTGPALASLRLANWSHDPALLAQLLAVYPAVRALALRGTAAGLRRVPAGPLPHGLRLTLQPPAPPALLRWLADCPAPALRTLEFTRQPPAAVLERLLAAHGPTLRALAVPSLLASARALVRARCPRLAVLRVEHPWTSPAVFKDAPPACALRRVAFGADADTPLRPVIEFVRAQPGVERVLMMLWTRRAGEQARPAHPQLDELREVCAQRGVQFAVETDARVFRAVGASRAFFDV